MKTKKPLHQVRIDKALAMRVKAMAARKQISMKEALERAIENGLPII